MQPFHHSVICRFDCSNLCYVPVIGTEGDGRDRVYLAACVEVHCNWRCRRFCEYNVVAARCAAFCGIGIAGADGYTGRVVVNNQNIYFGDANAVISEIGAGSIGCDRAEVYSFDDIIVYCFDGGGLCHIPVIGAEGEGGN